MSSESSKPAMVKPCKGTKSLDAMWKKHGWSWASKYPWLIPVEEMGAVTSLGCTICCQTTEKHCSQNSFASCEITSAQTSVFQKHEKSAAHQARAASLCEGQIPIFAPSVREFGDCLEAVWKGSAECTWKVRCMMWCLAEAHRNQLRCQLLKSESVAVQQDVRDNQLLLSFASADGNLKLTCGFLGQVDLADRFGLTSKDIAQATIYIVHKFSTRHLGKPLRQNDSPKVEDLSPSIDHSLVQSLQQHVEVFAADGASDEQRSGQVLKKWFPNLKLVQFDKAHAMQRVLSRTWPTDPYIHQLVESLVTGPDALTQKIRFSGIFRKRFQEAIAEESSNLKRIRDLACAKHRYLSASLPFRRAVLFFKPLLRVAQWIVLQRGKRSPEGNICRQWLMNLTSEAALQLAMVADATDEAMAVNRFFDEKNYCKIGLTEQLHKFLQKCTWLFDQRGALQTGFTAFMMKLLSRPLHYFLDGEARSLKQPSPQVINACFTRMQNWLQLARMTVKAEMPHFESLQLFRVFFLESEPARLDVERLAKMLELCPAAFQAEFLDLRPSAEWFFANGSKTARDAWTLAVEKTPGKHENLKHALIRLASWQVNTAQIERHFSKGLQAARKRGDVSESRLDDEVQLLDLNQFSKGRPMALPKHKELIEAARVLWTEHFGPPRHREKLPEHLKGKRKLPETNDTEAAFLRKRRREVDASAKSVSVTEDVNPVLGNVGQNGWSEKHEKEKHFLEAKLQEQAMRAIAEGAIPWSEISPQLQQVYRTWAAHNEKLTQDALRSKRVSIQRPPFPNLAGRSVWWPEAVQSQVGELQLRRLSRQLNLDVEESKFKATVHIWLQVSAPESEEDELLAGLHGKFVMDIAAFKSHGKKGSFLIYRAATSIHRTVFITPKFARDHVEVARNILNFCRPYLRTSSWIFEKDYSKFTELARKAIRDKKPTQVIVFGTEEEKQSELGNVKLFLQEHQLKSLSFFDPLRSAHGLEGA